MKNSTIQKDEWLTGLMGCDAYHLSGKLNDFNEVMLPESRSFVDVKVDVNRIISLMSLQNKGFRVVDTNVQLLRRADTMDIDPSQCRFANESDYSEVCRIAGSAFTKSRFHLDPLISPEIANFVKREWAGNFFKGKRGEWMIVAEIEGKVVGFLQVLKTPDSIVIDLIAVQGNAQGKGIASSMVSFANKVCLSRPYKILVGTQISNLPSLAFYTKMGFRIVSSEYVLHLHQQ